MTGEDFAHASVRGLIERDGRYLLLKHEMADGPIWGVPGGRAEIGEKPRTALSREVNEETGLDVTVGDPLEVFAYTWNDGRNGAVSVIFDCALVSDEEDAPTVDLSGTDDGEPITDHAWVAPNESGKRPMAPALSALLSDRRTQNGYSR